MSSTPANATDPDTAPPPPPSTISASYQTSAHQCNNSVREPLSRKRPHPDDDSSTSVLHDRSWTFHTYTSIGNSAALTAKKEFDNGDTVFVRPMLHHERGKRAVVINHAREEVGKPKSKRIQVRYLDTNKNETEIDLVMCKRLRLIPPSLLKIMHKPRLFSSSSLSPPASRELTLSPQGTTDVIVVAKTTDYRYFAASHVQGSDVVLEIGCSTGETSAILWKYAKSWVGFDTSKDMVALTTKRLEKSKSKKLGPFTGTDLCAMTVVMDALQDPYTARKEASQFGPPTVIFIDIGGNRQEEGVLRMIEWVREMSSFADSVSLIVIKSQELDKALMEHIRVNGLAGDCVRDGVSWLQERLKATQARRIPVHPLKAAKIFSPTDGTTPICRYHNYYRSGCAKGESCPFDHEYCHFCLQPGHIGSQCPAAK